MIWNFFAIGHGKKEVDGVGVLFKREVQKEQIKPQGKKLQNAIEIVVQLQAKVNKFHAITPSSRRHINKYFHLVKVGDVDMSKPYDFKLCTKIVECFKCNSFHARIQRYANLSNCLVFA
jgi:hypothetical protein